MAEQLERIYNIPLRKEAFKAPTYVRAVKATKFLREFLERHTKSDNIKIGKYLNQKILERGRKKPPHHVLVKVVKDENNIVRAELVGAPEEKQVSVKEIKKEEIAKPTEDKIDQESVKKEKEELEKKKILENPLTEKEKQVSEKKELSKERELEIRKKEMPKRKDKKEMISK